MTDVAGILRDVNDPESIISRVDGGRGCGADLVGRGLEGMIPKVNACVAAVKGGVKRAHIIGWMQAARAPHGAFTDTGVGDDHAVRKI